ncbi:hypothetical protein ACIQFP_10495 [Nocardiopsis alba]|uniref:hypothetical protein n=1 Tax=Nocardiopsis alba TaxID=53437 RepID=UPI00381821E8
MTTIHRLETLSSNGADYLARYVGNAPVGVLRHLREALNSSSPFLRDLREVDAVPGELLAPRGALDITAQATANGLMWDLSGRVGQWVDGPWVDLTVFAPGADAPLPVLFHVSWCAGKVKPAKASGRVSLAEARRRLAALD